MKGRKFESKEAALAAFGKRLHSEPLNLRTIHFYTETAHAVLEIMEADGLHVLPHEITSKDVQELLDSMARRDLAVATRKGYLSSLKKYVKVLCRDSTPFDGLSYRLPQDVRPAVEWYSPEEARILLSCDKTPLQTVVIHCELCLGMRHVEIIRLRVEDIHDLERYIDVRGKGPAGGKFRAIPFGKDTAEVLKLARARRSAQVSEARPGSPIPPNLILWSKAGILHAYSEEGYGLDKVVTIPLTRQLGFKVTNHKGRRTFGRSLYRVGVPVPTIAKILGHDSTEVTLRYIGVDLDDMRQAMKIDLFA